ncbi:polysaccharide pyruvyl transferase family protein [uncultured Sunxiuqinia sp.]|uniref:polysaccharide pyruvyl transferase family protein n=1 Tax=uncultured Sunxiuqinia sp. TaxID=1573825 RepID=UPI00261AD5C5|nr:polysaccharide pyruvyl transferase family protein [uncultured Sunxiuqinia sp.]
MTKIGIITVSRTNNYGAELQAFALQRKLVNMGFDAEIIDYLYFKHPKYRWSKGAKPIIQFSLKHRVKEFVLYRIVSPVFDLFGPVVSRSLRIRKRNFELFHKRFTSFSSTYRSYRELYEAKMDYDIYMVGSDQVWNPATGTSLEPYFLTFASSEKRKVSYASSFGVSEIESAYRKDYERLINNLDLISVREEQGVELVEELADRESIRVLDPTLLLDRKEWCKYESPIPIEEKKVILIYQLSPSETIIELANQLHEKTGFPIIRICKGPLFQEKNEKITNVRDAGPSEFLFLFNRAAYVITNSFHGTAFSVNFGIPFFVVLSRKKKNNSRLESFLELVGLKNRILFEDNTQEAIPLLEPIDYELVHEKLKNEQSKSLDFLTKSISVQ